MSDLEGDTSPSFTAAESCKPNETKCSGWCADLSSSPSHCGECGKRCFGNGAQCMEGECRCPSAHERVCDGMCVNMNVDVGNCGGCNIRCDAGLECRNGKCSCPMLGADPCQGQCVDMSSDAKNCGQCSNACAPDMLCVRGACACPKDTQRCAGACVDTRFAADSCGACRQRCPAGTICNAGACETPSGDWPMLQYDPGHTGVNTGETGKPPLVELWTRDVASGHSELSAPAMANGRVFIRSIESATHTRLFALNLSDGADIWSYDFGAMNATSPPAVADGVVYVASGSSDPQAGSALFAFDAVSGKKRWQTPVEATVLAFGAPIVVDDAVYGSTELDHLFSVSKLDGASRFSIRVGGAHYDWSPAICAGELFESTNDHLTRYDLKTGMMAASVALGTFGGESTGTPVCSAMSAYVSSLGARYAVDLTNNQVRWTATGMLDGLPAVQASSVYWIDQGKLVVVDASNGNEQWRFAADGELHGPPVIANDYVYVSSLKTLFAVRISSHEQVDQRTLDVPTSIDGSLSTPGSIVVASHRVLVTGADGKLRAFVLSP